MFVCTWCGEPSAEAEPVDGEGRCTDCMPADAEECSHCGSSTENVQPPGMYGSRVFCTPCTERRAAAYERESEGPC